MRWLGVVTVTTWTLFLTIQLQQNELVWVKFGDRLKVLTGEIWVYFLIEAEQNYSSHPGAQNGLNPRVLVKICRPSGTFFCPVERIQEYFTNYDSNSLYNINVLTRTVQHDLVHVIHKMSDHGSILFIFNGRWQKRQGPRVRWDPRAPWLLKSWPGVPRH